MSHVALTPTLLPPRVLSIAGTDPSGGAGTAADTKSITAAGGYAMSAVTAVVAQNTHGVRTVHVPPVDVLTAQLTAVSDDVEIDAVKTGMLVDEDVLTAVSDWLCAHRPRVVVVDPVMVATSGDRLLESGAERRLVELCRTAEVVTPNIDELAILLGTRPATDEAEARAQGKAWASATGVAIVIKTGHLGGPQAGNTWVEPDGTTIPVPCPRVETDSTHGTGCSLASALATRLAGGDDPRRALTWTTAWLHESIRHGSALRVGSGHGPIDHSHRTRRLAAAASSLPWLRVDAVPEELHSPDDLGEASTTPAPRAAVVPAGPWTAALWRRAAETIEAIAQSPFVARLVDGSLPEPSFSFYLSQDALYLARYSKVLAGLSAIAGTPEAQVFWAEGAIGCLTVESELHRGWPDRRTSEPGPVTSAYTDFLEATLHGEERAVACAAVLPCYWLYAQTGARLGAVPEDHPYAAWLATYADPEFVTATEGALREVERELAAASPRARAKGARAFLLACRHEHEFFEQALRIDATGEEPA